MKAQWHPSPNFGPRRDGALPDLVVLHFTAMASAQSALERLCSPEFEVSAHYLIGRDGQLWHMVAEKDRAWHAGAGVWAGVSDVNSRSIGIELDNDGRVPFAEPLMARLEELLPAVLARWDIPAHRVIGHSDMAPARKFDPGPRFDWHRLARRGLGCWPSASSAVGEGAHVPEATAPLASAFRSAAVAFGYDPSLTDAVLLAAFRLRFRPWASGPIETEDLRQVLDLSRRFPVDRPSPATYV